MEWIGFVTNIYGKPPFLLRKIATIFPVEFRQQGALLCLFFQAPSPPAATPTSFGNSGELLGFPWVASVPWKKADRCLKNPGDLEWTEFNVGGIQARAWGGLKCWSGIRSRQLELIIIFFFFAGVSLSKFPSFVDLNIHRFWLLKPIILGDARLMNWWLTGDQPELCSCDLISWSKNATTFSAKPKMNSYFLSSPRPNF